MFRCTWYPKNSGDKTVWHAALLDSFIRTCFDISLDALAGDDSDKSICLRILRGLWHDLHVVHHTQSSDSVRTHIGKSPACLLARMGVKEIELETLRSDARVGGAGAAGPVPELWHQQSWPRLFCKQKVELGIYVG